MKTQEFVLQSFIDPHPGIEILTVQDIPEKKPLLSTIILYHKVTKQEYSYSHQFKRPMGLMMYLENLGTGEINTIKDVQLKDFLVIKLDRDVIEKCKLCYPHMKVTSALMHLKDEGVL